MNRIYRLVFNAAHGLLQVASEHARGHGRGSGKLPDQTSAESLRNGGRMSSGNRAALRVAVIMALAAIGLPGEAWAIAGTNGGNGGSDDNYK